MNAYAAKNDLDPAVLKKVLHEGHESDEYSGPEEGSGESFATWMKMASLAGIPVTAQSLLERTQFVEVSTPDWRSMDVSAHS